MDLPTTQTAENLADRGFTTVVHDRVGRAESFREGQVNLDDELAPIAAMIEVAGGQAVLCGHSSGSAIALQAAADGLPADGLVMFGAPLDPDATGVAEWSAELCRLLDAGDRPGAVSHYMKGIPLDALTGLRNSPLWEPFVRHAESLRADAPGPGVGAVRAARRALRHPAHAHDARRRGDLRGDAGRSRLARRCATERHPGRGRRIPAHLGADRHGQAAGEFPRQPVKRC